MPCLLTQLHEGSFLCSKMNSHEGSFLCDVCGKTFMNKYNLRRHMRIYHGEKEKRKTECFVCDKFVASLASHMKTHTFTQGKLSCTECNSYKCHKRQQLRVHLENVHGIKVEKKEFEFKSMEDVLLWKEKMEVEENVSFIKSSSSKDSYYVCHRSGHAQTKFKTGQRLRAASIKIGRTCPASLKVTVLSTDRVHVEFYMTHTGHSLSVGSLRLTSSDRAMVADLIQQGLPDGAILKKVRDTLHHAQTTRLHLLDRQDISNVRREYKLDMLHAHVEDAVSVEMWVTQQRSLGADSAVVFYKAQGREDDREGIRLPVDAFMLVIMTPFQLEMAKKFCSEKVLIDTTHGTNKYKFDLTTLLTVDEFGVGCPVAYCLSTQTDILSMKVFFDQTKKYTGEIITKVFMSDDCETYYNAWSEVMGESRHRLLCSWHVDRAWRRNITQKVKGDMFLKSSVYKALKVLQLQKETDKFVELLDGFQHWCEDDVQTRDFGAYFANYYVGRATMWAYCFRTGLGLNTNMYLEAHHKTLKYSYLLKKVNNRVDKAIHAILLRTRDLYFERLRRLAKGTLKTARIASITRSHKKHTKISENMISLVEENTWHIQSHINQPHYIVTYADTSCSDCPLTCTECKICVHQYTCTCTDSLVRGNMCYHIHAIAIRRGGSIVPVQDRFRRDSCVQELTQAITQQPSVVASVVGLRAAFEGRMAVVQDLARSATDQTIHSLLGTVDKMIQVLKADLKSQGQQDKHHLPVTTATVSGNESCKRQRQWQFHPVKKNSNNKQSLRGPSYAESVAITEGLLQGDAASTSSDYINGEPA